MEENRSTRPVAGGSTWWVRLEALFLLLLADVGDDLVDLTAGQPVHRSHVAEAPMVCHGAVFDGGAVRGNGMMVGPVHLGQLGRATVGAAQIVPVTRCARLFIQRRALPITGG